MGREGLRHGAALGALVLLACGASLAQAPAWRTVETIAHDFDGDKLEDSLILQIPDPWTGNGDFTRIVLNLAGRAPFELEDPDGWVAFHDYLVGRPSEEQLHILSASPLKTKHVGLARLSPETTALMLFGYPYVSSPGKLSVVLIGKDGVRLGLQREFHLVKLSDLDGDGTVEIIGLPRFGQSTGSDPNEPGPATEVYTLADGDLALRLQPAGGQDR